jgi:hypothetical protein
VENGHQQDIEAQAARQGERQPLLEQRVAVDQRPRQDFRRAAEDDLVGRREEAQAGRAQHQPQHVEPERFQP